MILDLISLDYHETLTRPPVIRPKQRSTKGVRERRQVRLRRRGLDPDK
jgi:hypothetical protein